MADDLIGDVAMFVYTPSRLVSFIYKVTTCSGTDAKLDDPDKTHTWPPGKHVHMQTPVQTEWRDKARTSQF